MFINLDFGRQKIREALSLELFDICNDFTDFDDSPSQQMGYR